MPRACTVCQHGEREEIDRALVGGVAFPALVAKYRVSKDALSRHKGNHLPQTLVKAREAEEVSNADELLEEVRGLQERAYAILDEAEETGDLRGALWAIREARHNLELLARLLGELDQRTTVNVLVSPEWMEIRTVIVGALEPHPEARGAVLRALDGVEVGGEGAGG